MLDLNQYSGSVTVCQGSEKVVLIAISGALASMLGYFLGSMYSSMWIE